MGLSFRSLLLLVLAVSPAACGDDRPAGEPQDVDSGGQGTPPPPRTEDAGPIGPRPSCAAGADIELEPNDAPDRATEVLALKFCGALATTSDVDYFTFATPAGKKLTVFQAVVTEPIEIVVSVDGKDYVPGDPALFTSGTFVVKVSSKADKTAGYLVRIQYDPV